MTSPFQTTDDNWTLRAWVQDLHGAIAVLTRLPIPSPGADVALSPRTRRAFPLVGAFVGLAAGGAFFAGHDMGLPLVVNTVLSVAALLLLGGYMERDRQQAALPLMVATMLKLAAVYVIGNPATPGGGPHMVVVALVASGALSQAASLLLEPTQESDDPESADTLPESAGMADPKVVILPPDGTHIAEEDFDEGNGRELAAPTTAVLIALAISLLGLGLLPGAVTVGGAVIGAWVAPRMLAREIEADVIPMSVALQQSGEVWALLGLAILMSA